MKAEKKIIEQKMSVLELGQALCNITEACRRRGVSRTQFYEWKRRFQTHGLEGLKDLPPVVKNHPLQAPPETDEKIKELALLHPSCGCRFLEALLASENVAVSSVTIQWILDEAGLGKRYERWLALEQKRAADGLDLSAEQIAFIEQ